MAHDKNNKPLATGDVITLECEPTNEKAAPGYAFLRTAADSEGYMQEFAVHESQVHDGKVGAVVEYADERNFGRNVIVKIKAENGDQREHYFAVSGMCVAKQEMMHAAEETHARRRKPKE